ncbi:MULTISPECIES: DUF1804 family protein [Serratia]|uniref:DUF1804 family protein n=1 Tax=Serratia TaxID=613 RepID=UPI000744DDB5|nr:DUF1804 family protein [Serratia marcescens]ELJ5772354.1 DUF1804 family protein [Serratia marcescens]ELJ5816410.1 DUF1804 family protein [Serratia marcescens]ELN8909250.1 DUF1804 family protein [Serratia marcescens]ELT0475110.1 DUF1804 family protein [Serratia marcescens]EMB2194377.1 DUF1804 family protein [Serratia marcescens]
MAYPPETRDRLRRAYVFDGLSLEVAAVQCGVSYGTAQRWKNDSKAAGDDWETLRGARMLAGGGLEELTLAMFTGLVVQFKTTIDKLAYDDVDIKPEDRVKLLASLSDAFNKAVASSKRAMPEVSRLAIALEVIQLLAAYIKDNHPQQLQPFGDLLEGFGKEIERIYG